MYKSETLAFTENFGCLFVPRHQSFYSRPLLRMLRGKLTWRRQGPLFFFMEEAGVFNFVLLFLLRIANSHYMAWLCCGGRSDDLHTTEFPTCLANHEARARTHQTEEEYKELQVGPCI